jgi:double-stranded uracil-DNA glycosylase
LYLTMRENHNMVSTGFPPIIDAQAQVLILGTLPGQMSLKLQRYYAQPRNAFWPIIAALCGFDPAADYATRIAGLRAAGLALWDVCAAAERPGSLDASIARDSIIANDFAGLFAAFPTLMLIAHNGATSATLYQRRVLPGLPAVAAGIARVVLPSTSPAHAAMRYDEKLARWRAALSTFPKSRP